MRNFFNIIHRIFPVKINDVSTNETNLQVLLTKGASGTFLLKLISIGLGFITSIILARVLGAVEYGSYIFAIAWVGVLSVPGIFGMDKLLVRNISAYHNQSKWGLAHGLLQRSSQFALIITISLTVVAGSIGWILLNANESQLYTFLIALIFLPFSVLNLLRMATMQALHYVVLGQMPEMLIRPVFFIILVGSTYFLLGQRFSAAWAMGLNVVAIVTAFIIGTFFLYKILPQQVKIASPEYETRIWLRSALPLLFVGGMHIINAKTDVIMLGAIKGAGATGIYAVAAHGAELITFILFAVNISLGPIISRLYAAKEMERLQRIITKSARLILFFSLPLTIGLIAFSYWFLLIFGTEFVGGKTALIILSIAQLINAAAGSVSLILIMTKHEQLAALGVGISAAINVILNALLIPCWGLEGAATATLISIIIWNFILIWFVWQRLGINPTALGKVRFKK